MNQNLQMLTPQLLLCFRGSSFQISSPSQIHISFKSSRIWNSKVFEHWIHVSDLTYSHKSRKSSAFLGLCARLWVENKKRKEWKPYCCSMPILHSFIYFILFIKFYNFNHFLFFSNWNTKFEYRGHTMLLMGQDTQRKPGNKLLQRDQMMCFLVLLLFATKKGGPLLHSA